MLVLVVVVVLGVLDRRWVDPTGKRGLALGGLLPVERVWHRGARIE